MIANNRGRRNSSDQNEPLQKVCVHLWHTFLQTWQCSEKKVWQGTESSKDDDHQ